MTDANLRKLERRSRETGSVQDEARFLRASVQGGVLSRDHLELAALLGGAAALAVENQRLAQIDMLWEAWEAGLASAPPEMVARAFVAMGRFFMRSLTPDEAEHRQIQQDYLALESAILGEAPIPRLGILYQAGETPFAVARNLHVAAFTSFVREQGAEYAHHFQGEDRVQRGLDLAARHESSATLLGVVRAELSPWLLGGADPLRDRVRFESSPPSS